ncbi:hypothetical protein ASD78_18350 [Lysobacter sp. Root667]|nr:hypothetical protein ASD78_18350 [Lysobacter sp. Root667]
MGRVASGWADLGGVTATMMPTAAKTARSQAKPMKPINIDPLPRFDDGALPGPAALGPWRWALAFP